MKILKSNEFINENKNTELTEYLNKRKKEIDKVFKVTGVILNYLVYDEMKPFNTGFNELALCKDYDYYYTIYPLNNGKLIYDERGYACCYAFEKFCKFVVNKDISIKSKKKLIDMINYYFSKEDEKRCIDNVKDTDILDFLKPSADTYKRKGAIKISTDILDLIIDVKTSCEITKSKNEKGNFGMVSPLDYMRGYEVRKLGEYFGLPLSKYSSVEGNEGANFMSDCGVYCRKVGANYEIVKDGKARYGVKIQNEVYSILMKAQSFDLTNISNLYITNHKDTQSGKFIRKGYLSTAIKYLGMLIELKERDNYNSYSGRTFVELTFNKKDMSVYNEWIDVFNFDSTKFYMEKQGQNCVVTIKFKDFE